jgi:protein tyrosine phosphatase (PTP) superfamily phosphohydrolase (DUF442 family)
MQVGNRDYHSFVRGEMARWGKQLQREVPAEYRPDADRLLSTSKELVADNAPQLKRELREQLWTMRDKLRTGSPELRKAHEKFRNLALDNNLNPYPSGRYTFTPNPSDLPNYMMINDNLIRGGQADQDGLHWLAKRGVRTEVDLRGDDRDNSWYPPTHFPLQKCFHIAVPDFAAPTFEQVEEFLEIVNNPANQPVYFHCKAGIGRTGVMTACWRVSQGMSAEEALGLERINCYHGSLKQEQFVRDFEAYWTAKQEPKAA